MKNLLSRLLATVFYLGFIPGAPGTYGSLAAAVAFYLIGEYVSGGVIATTWHVVAIVLVTLVGVPASALVSKQMGDEDPSCVIIDEVAGQLLTYLLLPFTLLNVILGFIAFRAFDIYKPWPIRKLEPLPHGIGIMADDLLAGVYGCVVLHVINLLLPSFR